MKFLSVLAGFIAFSAFATAQAGPAGKHNIGAECLKKIEALNEVMGMNFMMSDVPKMIVRLEINPEVEAPLKGEETTEVRTFVSVVEADTGMPTFEYSTITKIIESGTNCSTHEIKSIIPIFR